MSHPSKSSVDRLPFLPNMSSPEDDLNTPIVSSEGPQRKAETSTKTPQQLLTAFADRLGLDSDPLVPLSIEFARKKISTTNCSGGSGDCFLLPFGSDSCVLMDSGNRKASKNIKSALQASRRKIIGVILSHEDDDHAGGIGTLLEQAPGVLKDVEWVVTSQLRADSSKMFWNYLSNEPTDKDAKKVASEIFEATDGRVLIYSQSNALYRYTIKSDAIPNEPDKNSFLSREDRHFVPQPAEPSLSYPRQISSLEVEMKKIPESTKSNEVCPFVLYRGKVGGQDYHYLFGADASLRKTKTKFNEIPRNHRDFQMAYDKFKKGDNSAINSKKFAEYLLKDETVYSGKFDCCQVLHHGAITNNLEITSSALKKITTATDGGLTEDQKRLAFAHLLVNFKSNANKYFCTGAGTKYHCNELIWQALRLLKIPLDLAYSPIKLDEDAFILEHHHNLRIMYPRHGTDTYHSLPFPIFPLLGKTEQSAETIQTTSSTDINQAVAPTSAAPPHQVNTPFDQLNLFLFELRQLYQDRLKPSDITIDVFHCDDTHSKDPLAAQTKPFLVQVKYANCNFRWYLLPHNCLSNLTSLRSLFKTATTAPSPPTTKPAVLFKTIDQINKYSSLETLLYYLQSRSITPTISTFDPGKNKPIQVTVSIDAKSHIRIGDPVGGDKEGYKRTFKIPNIAFQDIAAVVKNDQVNGNPDDVNDPSPLQSNHSVPQILITALIMLWYGHEFSFGCVDGHFVIHILSKDQSRIIIKSALIMVNEISFPASVHNTVNLLGSWCHEKYFTELSSIIEHLEKDDNAGTMEVLESLIEAANAAGLVECEIVEVEQKNKSGKPIEPIKLTIRYDCNTKKSTVLNITAVHGNTNIDRFKEAMEKLQGIIEKIEPNKHFDLVEHPWHGTKTLVKRYLNALLPEQQQ